MRRLLHNALCVLLSGALVLMGTGCAGKRGDEAVGAKAAKTATIDDLPDIQTEGLEFGNLDDPNLRQYIRDAVYRQVAAELSDDYVVDKVEATYVSQEYIDELTYNSQANIYFGYTLDQLKDVFKGERYVFTVDEDGKTTVKSFEPYDDSIDYGKVLKDVAIGGGVILVCVTVSAVTAGAGMPAASMIFAVAAKSGATAALSGAVIGGATNGLITGLETGNMDEAIKVAATGASEGFKLGAIGGAIGGATSEAVALHGATSGGLTMNQVATIQKESGYPLDFIEQINNMDQYKIFKDAGLKPKMINGKTALVGDIDLDFVDEKGLTNLERMLKGQPPIESASKKAFELHHIGQSNDSTLAMLSQENHRLGDAYKVMHPNGSNGVDHGAAWAAQKKAFWKAMGKMLSEVG